MKSIKRVFAILLAMVMIFGVTPIIPVEATQSMAHNFYSATYSSDPGQYMANIGLAQKGRSGYDLGYNYTSDYKAWCADFVGDCAIKANQQKAVPLYGGVAGLLDRVQGAGGYKISSSEVKAGDLVFYYCSYCGSYTHVGLAVNNQQSVQGNLSDEVMLINHSSYLDAQGHTVGNGISMVFIRPAYSGTTPVNYLDVNLIVDGVEHNDGFSNVTFDVYINGSRVADNVTDYCVQHPKGTKYEIKDIQVSGCYRYESVTGDALSGTIGDGYVSIGLVVNTYHYYGAWTRLNDSQHQHVCSRCSKTETANHTWDNGAANPAYNTCTVCGAKISRTVVVSIRPAGGIWNGSAEVQNFDYVPGTVIDLGKPTRDGYDFVCWRIDYSGTGHLLEPWGEPLHYDPSFSHSYSDIKVYNLKENDSVSVSSIPRTSDAQTSSANMLEIKTTGEASPGLGGFYQLTSSAPSAVFYHMIVAKIPVGYKIERASNATGDGAEHTWITSQEGTGEFEVYIYKTTCGSTGSFSTFGHVYLSGPAATASEPVVWYVSYSEVFDATNVKNSRETYTVGTGLGYIRAIWKKGHKWDAGTVTTEPTCSAEGGRTFTCSICGETKTEAIPALGHEEKNVPGREATCTEAGLTNGVVCERCNEVLTAQETIPALGHQEKNVPGREATCTEAGFSNGVVCERCGEVLTAQETVPALGHDWSAWVKLDEDYHQRVCGRNASHVETAAHEWDSGVRVSGGTKYTCATCSATRIVEDPTPVETDLDLEVASVKTQAGETVTLDVYITKAAPVNYLRLTPTYDKNVLTLTEVRNGDLFDTLEKGTSFLFNAESDVNATGLLATLTFTVAEDAEAGDYEIGLSVKEAWDYNEDLLHVGVTPGVITVRDFIYGDVNGDGVIDGRDLVRLRKYLANLDENTGVSSVEIFPGADCTGDGTVDGRDLIRLRKFLANYDEETGTSPIVLGP